MGYNRGTFYFRQKPDEELSWPAPIDLITSDDHFDLSDAASLVSFSRYLSHLLPCLRKPLHGSGSSLNFNKIFFICSCRSRLQDGTGSQIRTFRHIVTLGRRRVWPRSFRGRLLMIQDSRFRVYQQILYIIGLRQSIIFRVSGNVCA